MTRPSETEVLAQVHTDRFGLYFHVPFCRSKCPYCDFVSFPLETLGKEKRDRLAAALRKELVLTLETHPELAGRKLDTIYFGGGTPSLLTGAEIAEILAETFRLFTPRVSASDVEITLECNPTASETERLAATRDAGVNRISLGVQSFDAGILTALGRGHSPADVTAAIQRVRDREFASWGLDLIFGAPGSSLAQWENDLESAVSHAPPHISVYGLTLHKGTSLFEMRAASRVALPGEETQRRMFLTARSLLTAAGWEHYEISNYARPGHRSCHNSLYWTLGEYLGVGLGASSYWGGRRRINPASPDEYLQRIESGRCPAETEPLPSLRSLRAERIMLCLRQCEGVEVNLLNRLIGCDFQAEYAREIQGQSKTDNGQSKTDNGLSSSGLLEIREGRIRLTEEGVLLSDMVFETFF